MKHIKTYENLDYIARESVLTSVCLYFEEVIPITEEEDELIKDEKRSAFIEKLLKEYVNNNKKE